ncbi:MAG: hypothetical protein AAFX40_03780 [Cyanobacteria bacterium J06639_1]
MQTRAIDYDTGSQQTAIASIREFASLHIDLCYSQLREIVVNDLTI